ncbi:protein FAM135B-like isoform X2 [Asparagus officinalis]|uniref:protein FAM135B-like isoform X2 n=1 Tax=Asparagus officinalis TaxID=4686 RepID=UPI00098E1CB8|nr:protein FAM135B-like isoform X2 [Asparagus officinalis]
MFRRMRCFIGLDPESEVPKRLTGARASTRRRRIEFKQPDMLETVHEIAIYIHRFHNLDLFQQGWYQIKISMRWEDSSRETRGTPARVVQYEAPDLASEDVCGVWRIDDVEQSFSTQPFRIKYARQDVLLSVMVSFNLNLGKDEMPSTSAVILKFELMYAPILENGVEMQASFDAYTAAVHEFRIPPKALLGLHSYCPVHFDVFHAVLVDLSIHISLLKSGTSTPRQKVASKSAIVDSVARDHYEGPDEVLSQGIGSKAIELIKALLISRELLLEELEKISRAIGRTIDDLVAADLDLGRFEFVGSSKPDLSAAGRDFSGKKGVGRVAGMLENILEKSNGIIEVGNDVMLYSLSKEELLDVFFSVGNQLSFIWNVFLKFHRTNRMKILEYLYDAWAIDRKAEWSIWMVYSKIDIPHRYLRSAADDSSHRNTLGKVVTRKSNDEQALISSTRAELHRKSIAQMKINTRSIQDMHIFGDPSHVPIVLIEQHVMNVPLHGSAKNLSFSSLGQNDSAFVSKGRGDRVVQISKKNGRLLKVAVFVHGFQGHHLDLRLVRNQWLLLDPGAECLMSEANEDKTSGDFREMGRRLAEEVTTFIRKKMDKLSKYGGCRDIKLSFVGHSIGNVIIRSALADSLMGPFLKHLYTYMSLSGPHLGYWYSSNSLFNSGLWLLKKLKGPQVIHQLTFSDDPDLQNTFFYKLCKKTLENFKNIILLSSPQDGYVPYHSARIELCQASASDQSKKAQVFLEMLNNCLDQIRAPSSEQRIFMRCDVNFDQSAQGRNLNTIIGRAAHIEFLETDIFARFLMWSFPELFR